MSDAPLTPEQEQERQRALYASVELGIAAHHFCESKLGQKMILDSETERRDLGNELVKLVHDGYVVNKRRIEAISRRIAVLDCWQQFIADYIEAGHEAETMLTEGDQAETTD